MINKLRTSTKLYLLVFVSSIVIIGIGVYGLLEMKTMNKNMQTLYIDRVLPLQQLTQIRYSYLSGILTTAEALKNHTIEGDLAQKQIENTEKVINNNWKAYLKTYLTPKEVQIVQQTILIKEKANQAIIRLKQKIQTQDRRLLGDIRTEGVFTTVNAVIVKINELAQLQIIVSNGLYQRNQQLYSSSEKKIYILIVVSLLFTMLLGFLIINDIRTYINDLKISNTKIRQAEAKCRTFIKYAGDSIFMLNKSLMITDVNNSTINLLGYSYEELLELHISEVMTLEEQELFFAKMKIIDKVGSSLYEIRLKRKDEILVDTEVNIRMLEGIGYIAIIRDITERIKTQAALKKSEEKFHSLVDYAADAIFLVTAEGIIFDVNRSATTLLYYTKEELIGKSSLALYPQDVREKIPLLWETLRNNKSFVDERLLLRKDGTTVEVEISRNMLPDGSGAIAIVRDITERNIAINRIKASEERVMRVMHHSPMPLTITSSDHKISFVNKQFIKTFGYTIEDLPTIAEWWVLAYPDITYREGIRKEWLARIDRHIATKMPFEPMESIVHCKDGSNRYIEFHFADMDKEFLVNFYDITSRKIAEENLRQSEEKHRALIENISDGILLIDENWNVVYQSPSVERIVGFTIEDRKGKSAIDFIHPDDIQLCLNQYEKARTSPSVPFQSQYRSKNKEGGYIWIEVFLINLIENKSVKSYVVIYRDITERKKLEEQQLLMSSIVNSSSDAIVSKTLDGIITSWNHGAEKILGYAAEDIIGQHISIIIPFSLRGEEQEIIDKINAGHSVEHFETQRISKDGTILDVSLTVSPIKDSLGKVIGSSKILRDVTNEKKTQRLLKHQNEKLLEIAHFQSHIVRKPVANVLGLISLIDVNNPDAPENLELIPMLDVASKELDEVIHQIVRKTNEIKTLV